MGSEKEETNKHRNTIIDHREEGEMDGWMGCCKHIDTRIIEIMINNK
jgi:hypothetical protein